MTDIKKIRGLLEHLEDLSPSGFAIAFHIRHTAPDFLFQTYPKNWIDIYSEKGYVMVDPIVRWGFSETGSIRWSKLGTLDDQNVLKQSADFGMSYGVAIATETKGSRSVAGMSRSDREYTDHEIADLTVCVQDIHDQTASTTGMTQDLRSELHRLSVKMTHPATISD